MKEPDSYHVDLWVAVRRGQWRESPGRALIQTPRSRCSPPPREQSPAARGCCSAAVWSLRSSGAPLSLPSSSLVPPAPPLSSHRRECSPPGTEQIINPTPENINYLVFAVHLLLSLVLTVSNTNINSYLTFPFCLSIASYIFHTGGSGSGPVAVTWAPISYKLKREEKLSFILINQIEPTVVVFNSIY